MKKPVPQSPEQSLVATLQEPVPQSLESIFKEYIEATRGGDTDAQRVFAMMQVQTLIRLAEELGHGAVLEPVRHVVYALAGLSEGATDPILKINRGRKGPANIKDQAFRAVAAVAMDQLMRSGLGKKAAAAEVARCLTKKAGRKGITAVQVAKWRETATTEHPEKNLIAARFKRLTQRVEASFDANYRNAAEHLTAQAPHR